MTAEIIDDSFEEVEVEDRMKSITTSCKKCVFSIKEGKTQVGCELGKIDTLIAQGVNIIEAEDLEENEFYVLEHGCRTYREEIWKTANKGKDLKEVLEKEIYPRMTFIVLVRDDLDGIETTISSILNQERFQPKRILIVNTKGKGYIDLIEKSKSLLEDGEISYKVQNILDELTDDEILDKTFCNISGGFYSVFESGKEVPIDLIKTLNQVLSYKVEKAGYIKGFDGINGLTVQSILHKFLYGNRGASLEKKIREGEEFDEVESTNSLIRTWDELR
tara:strand:- start:2180 stop:3007 length:828 start_codon:yes stop_codon:yes gene_type:complete